MDKIVVKLYIPCLEQEYDVKIPTFLTVGEVIPLLSKSVVSLSDGKYYSSGKEILCIKDKNKLLDYQYHLSDYEVQDGDCLILI